MWIELTRNSKHMAKLKGLDEEVVKATPNTLEELKVGQQYSAMVVSCSYEKEEAMNLKYSQPIQLQVSPYLRGSVPFNHIISPSDLVKFGYVTAKVKVGDRMEVTYIGNQNFSMLIENSGVKKTANKKGDLVAVRFVKYIVGKGVTVQVTN